MSNELQENYILRAGCFPHSRILGFLESIASFYSILNRKWVKQADKRTFTEFIKLFGQNIEFFRSLVDKNEDYWIWGYVVDSWEFLHKLWIRLWSIICLNVIQINHKISRATKLLKLNGTQKWINYIIICFVYPFNLIAWTNKLICDQPVTFNICIKIVHYLVYFQKISFLNKYVNIYALNLLLSWEKRILGKIVTSIIIFLFKKGSRKTTNCY